MPLLVSKLRLRAAAGSMHQFLSGVRELFPTRPSDETVEAATAYLYTSLARDVFGRRFRRQLQSALRGKYKFGEADAIESCVDRIDSQRQAFLDAADVAHASADAGAAVTLASAIRSILMEADADAGDDPELVRDLIPPFENQLRRIKSHLQGIRQQSYWILRKS